MPKTTVLQRLSDWFRTRRRLYHIYCELGYLPWHKASKPCKERKPKKLRKKGDSVYIGAFEVIPFLNGDGKRTFAHLFARPGYMMRDYILRGQHERYLAPFTALLVFYSVFTLLLSIVQPNYNHKGFGDGVLEALHGNTELHDNEMNEKAQRFYNSLVKTASSTLILTHLDLYPEAVDTPWKGSLAAVEADLRGKGVPIFLDNFLLLWLSMAILLRKYRISLSGAAAASAYVLCQYCTFLLLALILTLGKTTQLGVLLMGILLLIDYTQMLGLRKREAFGLTIKTGLLYLGFTVLFYLLIGAGLLLFSYSRM
jgi:hypothetical protein